MESVHRLWELYQWSLRRADPRVQDWPLMDAYWPTWALTLMYLGCVYGGMYLMRHRKPLELRWTLVAYNAALVCVNWHIFSELLISSFQLGYSYTCQSVVYSDNPYEVRIAKALWWYYISKCFEFMDTIFFVLRKKNRQVSFLHVYHHSTMFPIWWIGVKWAAGGQSFFGALMNSGIHVIMYTYYGISAMGPEYQKYVWWKRYLTKLQLVQFILGMAHAAQSLYFGCDFIRWMQVALVIYGSTILGLFLNFYYHSYVRPAVSQSSTSKDSNGLSKKRR